MQQAPARTVFVCSNVQAGTILSTELPLRLVLEAEVRCWKTHWSVVIQISKAVILSSSEAQGHKS